MIRFFFRGKNRGSVRGVNRRIRLSGWALWIERIAGVFWPLFAIFCLFLAAAVLGAFALAGPVGHRILLGLFGLSALIAVGLGVWRFRRPGGADAVRRLEETSPHRPLSVMADTLASGRGSPVSEAVWQAHRQRAEEAALALRVRAPNPQLAARDRWALRLFAPAALMGALLGGDADIRRAVAVAVSPAPLAVAPFGSTGILRAPAVEAWATPPGYTGLETVYLTGRSGSQPMRLPVGSEIVIQTSGLEVLPELIAPGLNLSGLAGGGFSPVGGGMAEAVAKLTGSGPVRVTTGETVLDSWILEKIADAPPQIEFADRPRETATQALEVAFRATDDYGVAQAWAEIRLLEEDQGRGLDLAPVEIALPLPIARDAREAADGTIADLTDHPWAGSHVGIALFAEDGAGQIGRTKSLRIRLPARRMNDPLAASLIEQRRDLAMDLGTAPRVLDVIQSVTRRPQEIFGTRYGPHLGTRVVVRRLAAAVSEETVAQVAPGLVDMLWHIALSLEGGDLSDALEQLRAAERRLRDALENGTDEEVARAIEDLRQAMHEYLREFALTMERDPNQQGPQQDGSVNQSDLEEMLDELQRRAESGLRDEARDMLGALNRILENLQAGGSQPQGFPGQRGLEEAIRRQRDLADRTFDELRRQRQSQQNQGPGEDGRSDEKSREGGEVGQRPGENSEALAGEQEALRKMLEGLRRKLPGVDDAQRALEEAGEAMGNARDALQSGDNSQAMQDQMEALDRLGEGMRALAGQGQNGRGNAGAGGLGYGNGGNWSPYGTDPFNRALGSNRDDRGGDNVPDRSQLDRARELLEELRQRSAEPHRPEMELEYYDRLLEKF